MVKPPITHARCKSCRVVKTCKLRKPVVAVGELINNPRVSQDSYEVCHNYRCSAGELEAMQKIAAAGKSGEMWALKTVMDTDTRKRETLPVLEVSTYTRDGQVVKSGFITHRLEWVTERLGRDRTPRLIKTGQVFDSRDPEFMKRVVRKGLERAGLHEFAQLVMPCR